MKTQHIFIFITLIALTTADNARLARHTGAANAKTSLSLLINKFPINTCASN